MTRSDFLEQAGRLSREQLLLLVADLHDRQASMQARSRAPIAIIGTGCRFPRGVESLDAFWAFLRDGGDGVDELPPHRRRGSLAAATPLPGAFLDDVSGFDCGFFGITPTEALRMDPQQRLFLELAWEAAEAAGLTRERLAGSRTGVFAALCETYYAALQFAPGRELDAWSGVGASPAALAGRVSYLLDLHGPNVTVETACSSALVAVHLAVRSLRSGECDLAFVGGVNVISSRACLEPFTHMGVASAAGRCRTFDAACDGFVPGEGGGVLVLQRLGDAAAGGQPILAVIRGSAVNHTGRAAGLTAPGGASQAAVIRAALADAGADPSEIGYVEAHGTATPLGDPVEVEALAAALGPLPAGTRALGSVKTNLGHLGGAAGIAGLLEAALAVRHGIIPPHLHLRQVHPDLPLEGASFVIPTAAVPWNERPRVAGVSAFGWTGTNAHVVIAEAPAPEPRSRALPRMPLLLPLSARSDAALRAMAAAWSCWLRKSPPDMADVAYTASCRRTHHPFRLAVLADTPAGWADALDAWSRGEAPPLDAAGARYVAGGTIAWTELWEENGLGTACRCVPLPTYPWQRETFDPESGAAPADAPRAIEQWLHAVSWEEQPRAKAVQEPRETWWVVGDPDGSAGAHAAELTRRGWSAVAVPAEGLDPAAPLPGGIAFVGPLDMRGADPWPVQRAICGTLLRLAQRAFRAEAVPRLVVAMAPGELAHAPLRGLARSLALEHPELRCRLVEIDEDGAALAEEIVAPDGAAHVRLAGGRRLVPRLRALPPSRLASDALRLDAGGTYVITGGLGALGLRVAQRLAGRGAGRLVLLGRRAPSPDALRAIAAMPRATQVIVRQADVADLHQLAAALEPELASIRGVVHAAGTIDDGFAVSLDWSRFEAVLAPKVLGAWNLHRLLDGRDLDFFALFSSAAAVTGNAGQTHYAAANAFLDALAESRRRAGRAAVSIQWGPWAEIGMAAAEASLGKRFAARGIRSIAPDDGLHVFERIVASDLANVAVFAQDAPRDEPAPELRYALLAAPPADRRPLLLRHVREVVAGVTGIRPERIAPDAAFAELGVDSIMALDIHGRLTASLGVELPVSFLWFHPTAEALATHLASRFAPPPSPDIDDLAQRLRDEIAAAGAWRNA